MKIAFHTDQICIRGTSVALYDYARFNEDLMKNTSVIFVPENKLTKCDTVGMAHFVSRFRVIAYTDLERALEEEKVDLLYCIKYGKNDGIFSRKVKTVVHCVFDMSEPHGDVYAGVSQAVAKKYGKTLFVPHMIGLEPSIHRENFRKELRIPANAVVFGRYGGEDTFNLDFCWEAIAEIITERKDVYFLFVNTPAKVVHPQIKHLPKITDGNDKNKFICTCDAHLECGNLGHSFGLALGEFSVNNVPLIVYKSPSLWNTAHLDIIGSKGLYFENKEEFREILDTFDPEEFKERDNNCYRDYSPEKVMQIFDKVFISSEP